MKLWTKVMLLLLVRIIQLENNAKPELTNLKLTKSWRDTVQQINSLIGSVVSQKVNDGTIRFFTSSIGDYRKIQNFFIESKFEFYGLQLQSERPRKILIKSIPRDTPIENAKNELIQLGYSIHVVSQLKNFKTKLQLPIFLTNSFPSHNLDSIFYTKQFLGVLVNDET